MELAHTMVSSLPQQPTLLALAMLRMRDAERVALHNEIEHVKVRMCCKAVCMMHFSKHGPQIAE
jgi:hypothetical protein